MKNQFKVAISFSFYKEFYFAEAKEAVSFAQGYVEAIKYQVAVETPNCPQIDGYRWWNLDGRVVVAVYNKDNKYVTSKDF